MSYYDQLRDPRWQRKRLEVMQRDNFTCLDCDDATTTLNVHHTYYAKGRKPWEYETESLRTLCEPCHASVSGKLTELQRVLGSLNSASLDIALGYVRALAIPTHWENWHLCNDQTPSIAIDSYEVLIGVAAGLRISESELHEAQTDEGTLTWEGLRSIYLKRDKNAPDFGADA